MFAFRRTAVMLCSAAACAASCGDKPSGQGQVALRRQVALVDRQGLRTPIGSLPAPAFALRVSPDGQRLAFDTNDGVWVADFRNLTAARRLAAPGAFPMWSPDGNRVVYLGPHLGDAGLFWRQADGKTAAELLVASARAPESWRPASQTFSYITFSNGDYDVWTYSVESKAAAPLVAVPRSSQHSSRFSPDGRWIAYASDESGRFEIYVEPFPKRPGTRFQVTTKGGGHPLWSPDGKELFLDNGGQLWVVHVSTEPAFTSDAAQALPIQGFIQGNARRQFDMTPDGRFVMMFP